MNSKLARNVLAAFTAVSATSFARADVTILGKPGLGSFPTIQGAIDAASNGDVLEASAGSYASFVLDAKGLTIIGFGTVNVSGSCAIKNLAAGANAALVNLKITTPISSNAPPTALTLNDDLGRVRVQSCLLKGNRFVTYSGLDGAGHGLAAVSCPQVVVAQSLLFGGDVGPIAGDPAAAGGDGLNAIDTALAIYDCTLKGGVGSDESQPSGGAGGAGGRIQGWGAFVSGTTIHGGNGGGGDYIGCTTSGDGGDGLAVSDAQARLIDDTITAGAAGNFGPCGLGSPGQAIDSTGSSVTTYPGPARKLVCPDVSTDKTTLSLTFNGVPGDSVWLIVARTSAFKSVGGVLGVICVPQPTPITVQPLGLLDSSGVLDVHLPLGDYPGSTGGWVWYLQGLCIGGAGEMSVTTPHELVIHNT